MLCSRQSGKSTTSAVLAAHEAVYTPGALVLILSPTLRQSGELFAKVKAVLADAGEMAEPDRDSVTTLVLGNGSRIVSLPGTERTIRGFSAPSLVVIDEAARVRDEASLVAGS
jgi:phage terminase large subunit-like protein